MTFKHEKKCYNPFKGRKDPNTVYVVWYGDKEYYRSKVKREAKAEFLSLLMRNKQANDNTKVYLVKTRQILKQDILLESEDINTKAEEYELVI